GVGTTSPSFDTKLDVITSGARAVRGYTSDPDGTGVFGFGGFAGVEGEGAVNGIGIYGLAHGTNGVGVYGVHSGAVIDGYAGYFAGRVYVSTALGVNAAVPGFTLDVNGSAGKPGGGSWSTYSDARIKENIQPLRGALDKLTQLRGVSFDWKNPQDHAPQTGRQTGFLAQEV